MHQEKGGDTQHWPVGQPGSWTALVASLCIANTSAELQIELLCKDERMKERGRKRVKKSETIRAWQFGNVNYIGLISASAPCNDLRQ